MYLTQVFSLIIVLKKKTNKKISSVSSDVMLPRNQGRGGALRHTSDSSKELIDFATSAI